MMEREIYILGTSHEYQRNDKTCPPGSISEFKHYLKCVCEKYRIVAIGEEMGRTALEDFNIRESIPEQFAKNLRLHHKHCDPNRDEQSRFGIKESGTYTQTKKLPERLQPEEIRKLTQEEVEELEWNEDLKREPYWLCNLLKLNLWPLLYICGSKHVESFSKLLRTASFKVHVINSNWKPENPTIKSEAKSNQNSI